MWHNLFISSIVAPVFYKLLFMSLTGICIGVVIILIRRVADFYISPNWKFALWFLAFVALLMPFRPESSFSLINLRHVQDFSFSNDELSANVNIDEYKNNLQLYNSTFADKNSLALESKFNLDNAKSFILEVAIPTIWLAGFVCILLFMIVISFRLRVKIKKHSLNFDYSLYNSLLMQCKQKLCIDDEIRIVIQDYVNTPAIIGFFRPTIILPSYTKGLDNESICYILFHELSHLKRKDLLINYMLIAFQVVYWFNPLLWVLFKFARQDMELANDAYVLSVIGNENCKEYGMSLVTVLAKYNGISFAPRMLCMVDNKKNIERRIKMIKLGQMFKKRRHKIAVTSIVLMLCIGTMFLTTQAGSGAENASEIVTANEESKVAALNYEPKTKEVQGAEPGVLASNSPEAEDEPKNIVEQAREKLNEYLSQVVTEEDIQFMCNALDNAHTVVSSNNRSFSKDEETRYLFLTDEYTYEGVRPQNVLSLEPVGELYYDIKKDHYHYPDSQLTDEELLQLIDMGARVNYALSTRYKRSNEMPTPTESDITREEAISIAKAAVTKYFEADISDLVKNAGYGKDHLDPSDTGKWYVEYSPIKTRTLNAKGEKYWTYYVVLDSATGNIIDVTRMLFNYDRPELSEKEISEIASGESWVSEAKKIYTEKVGDSRKVINAQILGVDIPTIYDDRKIDFSEFLKLGLVNVALTLEDDTYCVIEFYHQNKMMRSIEFYSAN